MFVFVWLIRLQGVRTVNLSENVGIKWKKAFIVREKEWKKKQWFLMCNMKFVSAVIQFIQYNYCVREKKHTCDNSTLVAFVALIHFWRVSITQSIEKSLGWFWNYTTSLCTYEKRFDYKLSKIINFIKLMKYLNQFENLFVYRRLRTCLVHWEYNSCTQHEFNGSPFQMFWPVYREFWMKKL